MNLDQYVDLIATWGETRHELEAIQIFGGILTQHLRSQPNDELLTKLLSGYPAALNYFNGLPNPGTEVSSEIYAAVKHYNTLLVGMVNLIERPGFFKFKRYDDFISSTVTVTGLEPVLVGHALTNGQLGTNFSTPTQDYKHGDRIVYMENQLSGQNPQHVAEMLTRIVKYGPLNGCITRGLT